jgi:hypothetical protein
MDIGAWLRGLGLERYEPAFRDNDIDAEVLPELTADDLTALGVSSIGHRSEHSVLAHLFYDEFDVSEMSITETLLARKRSDGKKWDWSTLPVFLSRGHHWPYLYINTVSEIADLGDLRGRRIGVADYDMTAALWFRNTLKDLYGIEAKGNVWFNGRTKELEPRRGPGSR